MMEGFEKLEQVRAIVDDDSRFVELMETWLSDDVMARLADDLAKDLDVELEETE